ncbi:MAG: hypothetical protein Q4A71_00815 [Actinomycetaceae bacterium]|nr:hypothetical protein [Actinomycetaceae bacterium]
MNGKESGLLSILFRLHKPIERRYTYLPFFGIFFALTTYHATANTLAHTPLKSLPIIHGIALMLVFLFPVAFLKQVPSRMKFTAAYAFIIAGLTLDGIGWGTVIGVENATGIRSILLKWFDSTTSPLIAVAFLAILFLIMLRREEFLATTT